MTPTELIAELGQRPFLRVVHRNGKAYDVDRDVILANAVEDRPYLYGWPVVPKGHKQSGRVRWFYAANVKADKPHPAA